jgi:hypothetical protein
MDDMELLRLTADWVMSLYQRRIALALTRHGTLKGYATRSFRHLFTSYTPTKSAMVHSGQPRPWEVPVVQAHRLLCVTVALVLNVAQPDGVFTPDLNRFATFFWQGRSHPASLSSFINTSEQFLNATMAT